MSFANLCENIHFHSQSLLCDRVFYKSIFAPFVLPTNQMFYSNAIITPRIHDHLSWSHIPLVGVAQIIYGRKPKLMQISIEFFFYICFCFEKFVYTNMKIYCFYAQ